MHHGAESFPAPPLRPPICSLPQTGYIMAKAQSGYYVTEIASHHHMSSQPDRRDEIHYRYDLASSGVDRESFRFDLWSRYMKSALRQDERMLTYGEPQGRRISGKRWLLISGSAGTFCVPRMTLW